MSEAQYNGYPNAFFLMDTYGLPLGICMDQCEKEGYRVVASSFVYDAILAGWSFDKSIITVWSAWADKYGQKKADELKARLILECKFMISKGVLNREKSDL